MLGYERADGDDRRVVLINFTEQPVGGLAPTGTVEVASDGRGEGAAFSGTLGPDQAVLLR